MTDEQRATLSPDSAEFKTRYVEAEVTRNEDRTIKQGNVLTDFQGDWLEDSTRRMVIIFRTPLVPQGITPGLLHATNGKNMSIWHKRLILNIYDRRV